MPEITDQEKRACDEDHIVRRRSREGVLECLKWIGNRSGAPGKSGRHLRQDLGRDGSLLPRLGENDGVSYGKKKARNFVDRFVSHGAIKQSNSASPEGSFPK